MGSGLLVHSGSVGAEARTRTPSEQGGVAVFSGKALCSWGNTTVPGGLHPMAAARSLQADQKGTACRSWQDSNLRGETPMDF